MQVIVNPVEKNKSRVQLSIDYCTSHSFSSTKKTVNTD
jgi:hypothetical protein